MTPEDAIKTLYAAENFKLEELRASAIDQLVRYVKKIFVIACKLGGNCVLVMFRYSGHSGLWAKNRSYWKNWMNLQ